MEDHQKKRLIDINRGSASAGIYYFICQGTIQRACNIATGASYRQNRLGIFSHADQVLRGSFRAWKMKMRKLCNRVARAFVNRSGNFSALNVDDTDIHIGSSNGGRKGFISITDQKHEIRFEALKFAGKFHDAKAYRLGLGPRR